jgi:hypothetical protein
MVSRLGLLAILITLAIAGCRGPRNPRPCARTALARGQLTEAQAVEVARAALIACRYRIEDLTVVIASLNSNTWRVALLPEPPAVLTAGGGGCEVKIDNSTGAVTSIQWNQ